VKGKSVTHKIIEIRDENGKLIFVTQGVANPAADPPITSEQIVSKMVCKSGLLGDVVSLVNNKYGFLVIIILPLAVFLTSEVITLVKTYKECKEEQVDEDDKEN
jgi:signal peptidase